MSKVLELLKDSDLVDNWHSLYVAFGMQSAEETAARYNMVVPDGSVILDWIRSQEKKQSTLVNQTTADDISKILADARANGESIPDMVAKTRQYFDGIAYRAERVARTNVIACNNAAAQDVYAENGVGQHEWLSTSDDRVRDEHAAVDGQVRNIDEPFDVGGEQLMYPGDENGSAGNVINCRCTILPVIGSVPNTPSPDEPSINPSNTPDEPTPETVNVPQSFVDDVDRIEEQTSTTLTDAQRTQLNNMAAQMGDKSPSIKYGGRGAAYYSDDNAIKIGKAYLADKNLGSVLEHEMTHALQENVLLPLKLSNPDVAKMIDDLPAIIRKVTTDKTVGFNADTTVFKWIADRGLPTGTHESWAFLGDMWAGGREASGWGHSFSYLTGNRSSGFNRRALEVMAEYVGAQGDSLFVAIKDMPQLQELIGALEQLLALAGG